MKKVPKIAVRLPTAEGWHPTYLVGDVIDMINAAQREMYNGPYLIVHGKGWSRYMKQDYFITRDVSLERRLMEIPGVVGVIDLPDRDEFSILLMRADVVCEGVTR